MGLFLKIDGIAGESIITGHAGEIELLSWGWGTRVVGSSSQGGGGSGKVIINALNFSAATSKASPKLLQALTMGKHIFHAQLTVTSDGEARNDLMYVKLTDVTVTGFHVGQIAEQLLPSENWTLTFSK